MPKSPTFKLSQTIQELISEQRKPQLLPETGWWKIGEDEPAEIPFEVPWGNYGIQAGITYPAAAFYNDSAEGEVRTRGVVTGGGVGDIIFTYPPESRPEYRQEFTCAVIGGGTANLAVYPNGDLVLESLN